MFSIRDEDRVAGDAAAIKREELLRNHPEAAEGEAGAWLSNRVRSSDWEFQLHDGQPISLGEGGFGKACFFLSSCKVVQPAMGSFQPPFLQAIMSPIANSSCNNTRLSLPCLAASL